MLKSFKIQYDIWRNVIVTLDLRNLKADMQILESNGGNKRPFPINLLTPSKPLCFLVSHVSQVLLCLSSCQ